MKKILFLNTTKLAVLSAMLLLAVFCTIGMSFTPAEEGENVGNPNDSTYVTGPRRSSSSSSGCTGNSYENATDYGRVEVKIMVWDKYGTAINIDHSTVGSVTLTGNTVSGTTSGLSNAATISEAGTTYINWNSGSDWKNESYDGAFIKNRHTLTVTMEATTKGTEYEFYGWTKHIMQNDETYSPAFPPTKPTEITDGAENTDVIILGDVDDNGDENGFTNTYSNHNTTWEDSSNPHKVIYYAHFAPPVPVKITLKAAENGTYTYTDGAQSGTISTTDGSITTSKQITLTATPASSDYKFFGWYEKDGDEEKYLSYESPWSKKFTVPTTIYAKFIPSNAALFIIKGVDGEEYWNLNEACTKAQSSSSKIVLPKANGTLYPLVDGELCTSIPAGKTATDYTIPSGVTLLVPYEKDANFYTEFTNNMLVHETWAKPTCFRKLTLYEKCTMVVEGNLNVAASIYSVDGGKLGSGAPKVYGQIDMQSGSNITIKNTAKLYCWGFITGAEGFVEIESGGTVCESLQIQHHPGGTEASNWIRNKKALFLNQYYAQNIESPLRINTGAIEKVYATMYVYMIQKTNATFIGSTTDKDALFQLNGGYLIREYNSQKDRIVYNFYGDFVFNYLSLTLASIINIDIETTAYPLPVTNNMTINCHPHPDTNTGTMTLAHDIALLPGTEVVIDKNVTTDISGAIFVYDIEAWKDKSYSGSSKNITPVQFSPTCTYKRTITDLKDAKVELNGTLNIKSGGLINTTTGSDEPTKYGADICSSGGGVIKFETPSITEKTYQYANNSLSNPIEIPITPAQLHNGKEWYGDNWINNEWYKEGVNLEYLATAGVSASTTIQYANNHWGWMEIWKDHDGTILNINNTCTQTNESSAYEHNVLPEGYTFIGWSTEINDTNQEVIHTAQYTFGPELDIVDADNTKKTLTINANGWASSGWPYTINNTEYGKDDKAGKEKYRQADRTLVIPYTGTSGASLPIAVLDKDGKPICRHIYKVPFVYDSNKEMSGTDENSIVFVKSGTLTVGTASAKEIYVAPGAELKVNGTLTVGKLVLRTTPFDAAILTNNGTINGQVYYSRISPDAKQYYQFGLPLSCPLASVQMSNTGKLGGSQPKYGTAWVLKSYSESSRAQNGISNEGANWDLLPSEGTIAAGVGYEMFSNSNYYREFYFPVDLTTATTQVSVQYTGGTISAEHNGWNIITSPLTSKATVTIGDPATAIKVCWLNEDGSYRQEQPTVIPPAIPFSYQASAGGELNFAVPTIAAAPRKQSAAEALTETEWIHLDIFDAYGEGDETSLFVHPTRFEQTYKTGIDLAKQSLTASRPIISTHAYGDMAFAGVADSLLENGIDLVVYSPSAQELTFSLRENKFLNRLEYLWLADNETGARTDLLMNDYTFRADAGTAKGRFVLNGRFKAPQISTGIGNTQTDYNIYAIGNNIAISGVEQGTPIYVFDAVGHMIYTTAATSDEVIVPAPCAGVYMLSVGGQTAKLVINQ